MYGNRSNKRVVVEFIDETGRVWKNRSPFDNDFLSRLGRRTSPHDDDDVTQKDVEQVVPTAPITWTGGKQRGGPNRPGRDKDKNPMTGQYFVGVRKSEAEWLRERAVYRAMPLSRMLTCIGLGYWSLPANFDKIGTVTKGWTTITVAIRDSDWDQLVANGAEAKWPENHPAPAKPDPPVFCVAAALGAVKLAKPGPVLLTTEERQVVTDMQRVRSIATQWNPWLLPQPEMPWLTCVIAELQTRLDKNCWSERDVAQCKKLHRLVAELEARHVACWDCSHLWQQITSLANGIG
jgi:hypothetical protein